MSSSMSSSLSPSEEAYNTAEEDHHSYAQASSEASSTITTTLDGGSDSVYITANQTPTASPDVDRFSISLDSPTGEAPDESSPLWHPQSAPWVNGSQATSLEQTPSDNYLDRQEISDISYAYRPTPIDVDSQQQRSFLPTSPPSINNTSSLESNRTTYTHQGLAPIKEDEMPYDPSGRFIMNPRAPVFVPGQPAMKPRNPRDWVLYGAPAPKPGQIDAAEPPPTHTPPPTPQIPLFGSAHGMFFDPNTNLFTGDGPPRKSPYRPDGTLPSTPDLESDFLTKQQFPEPAEDQLHMMSKREYTKRMAHFGKEGTVQRFRVARPKKLQGVQQGMRVVVGSAGEGGGLGRRVQTGEEKGMEMEGEEDNVLGRRMQTANETEGEEGSVPSHRTHFPNEQEEEISMSGHRVQPWEETAAELARMRRTPGGPGSQD